jgi:hypothetical protein
LRQLAPVPNECIDFIYLDPPFFSNRNYEVIWGDEAEVRSFEDRWEGGIQVYIKLDARSRCSDEAYPEVDGFAVPPLRSPCKPLPKVMFDGVFESGNFRNEIVWKRTTAHNGAKRYGPVHDTILYYVVDSSSATWNQQHQAYGDEYVSTKSTIQN